MALIACPACERQVSDKAPTCPQCGHPIAAAYTAPAPQPAVAPPPGPAGSGGGGFCGGAALVLLLVVGGVGVYYFTQTEAGKKALPPALAPPVQEGPATLKLTRKDQLLGAAHRHTVVLNDQKLGLISNGATNSFEFTARSDRKTTVYVEAYDPFSENPKSNKLSLDVLPGDEVVATVSWVQNGTAFDYRLEADVMRNGQKVGGSPK